jgi:hypothetical protein
VTAVRAGDPAGQYPTRNGDLCGSPKKSGGTCGNTAGKGTAHVGFGHCRHHGGNSPGGTRMAQREAAYATARTLHLDVDGGGDVEDLLLGRVREQAGIVAWLREEVRALTGDALVRTARYSRRVTTSAGAFPGETTTVETGTQEHILSIMYARERKILDDLLVRVTGLGLARRHVEVAEAQGELAGAFVTAVLRDLDVDPASPRAREVIARRFTLLTGGGS